MLIGPYINYAVEKKHRTRHMFESRSQRSSTSVALCWYDLVQESIGTLAHSAPVMSFTSHRYGSPMMSRSELDQLRETSGIIVWTISA